jgi:hypothetical protein
MTAADKIRDGRLARLSLWNQLFHGMPIGADELDPTRLCGDSTSAEECAAYVTLRACVSVSSSSRQAIRCALRVAILYWFSNVGERRGEGRAALEPKRSAFHLGEAIGTGMTWDEAVASMKRKPIDFSAYLRVLEVVQAEYAKEWDKLFPGLPRAPIDALAGEIREVPFARTWESGRQSGICEGDGQGP